MKRVGIILRDYKSKNNNDLLGIRSDLIKYLSKYNLEIICIPVIFDSENEFSELKRVEGSINTCQGIILPGGANFYDIDLKIANYLYEKNIPTLGICLGAQIMATALNGDIETLKSNHHQSKENYVHEIKIKKNSLLHTILNTDKITVNSRHNDHILTTDLTISAISSDLIIEAIEDANKKFFLGVQWHPESLSNDIYSKMLFDYFLNQIS